MCVLLLMETVFVLTFAQHGGARGTYYGLGTLDPRQSRTSWPQSFPGPALCAPTPSPPSGPNSLLVFTCHTDSELASLRRDAEPAALWARRWVLHWCASCTSWCLQSHDPGLMTHSVAPLCEPGRPRPHGQVAPFVDVRSEPPSHDGVSNLGHPRLLSWRGCGTSWSGTPFSKGAVPIHRKPRNPSLHPRSLSAEQWTE